MVILDEYLKDNLKLDWLLYSFINHKQFWFRNESWRKEKVMQLKNYKRKKRQATYVTNDDIWVENIELRLLIVVWYRNSQKKSSNENLYETLIIFFLHWSNALCHHLSTRHTSVICNYYGKIFKSNNCASSAMGNYTDSILFQQIIAVKDISNWYFLIFLSRYHQIKISLLEKENFSNALNIGKGKSH